MKILKTFLIFTIISVYPNFIAAQKIEKSNLILGYEEIKEIGFYEYEPKLKIRSTIYSIEGAKNEYPEQLMESIISATSQDWVNFNTLGEEEEEQEQSHFDRIKSMDKDKNYFELHHKLSFNVSEIPTAIIKFFFYQENEKPVSASYVMQKVDNKWQRTSHSSLSTLSVIVMRMKSEVLEGIILGNSNDKNIISIKKRVSTNDSLDLVKLEEEFASWYDPEMDQRKIDLYKDPRTW